MRHYVATLGLVLLVGGACSLIYNQSNIKVPADATIFMDAPVDAKIGPMDAPEMIFDANPSLLALTAVEPASIMEGQGDDGSRKGVLVVTGTNIIPGATIAITGAGTPMVS